RKSKYPAVRSNLKPTKIMTRSIFLLFLFLLQNVFAQQRAAETYPVDPASQEQPGVPKGELIKGVFNNSNIFPGTSREYWIYVPEQYDPATPACVYVNQDGMQWNAPTVFDNLIYRKEMPVTIGIFCTPGKFIAQNDKTSVDRYNRSIEYDDL